MLADPITLTQLVHITGTVPTLSVSGSYNSADLSLPVTGIAGSDVTRAVSGCPLTGTTSLSVRRSTSKENAGQTTDRVAIRIETNRDVTIADANASATAQCTLTVSLPRYGFTHDEVIFLAESLFAVLSDLKASGTADQYDAPSWATLKRICDGEA